MGNPIKDRPANNAPEEEEENQTLRELRREKGYRSVKALAEEITQLIIEDIKKKNRDFIDEAGELHITERTIYAWENGEYMPRCDNLFYLGKALDVSLDELNAVLRYTKSHTS